MRIVQKGIVTASFVALLTASATAIAAPPGKADYNFDPAAENASRYGGGCDCGYSFGYANPYAAYGTYGTTGPGGATAYSELAYPAGPAGEPGYSGVPESGEE